MRTLGDLHKELADAAVIPNGWEESVASVDRALFIPKRVGNLDYDADQTEWREVVYSDAPVVTQYDDGAENGPGVPTASSSKPSAMLEMLDLLDVHDGMRVWEIGTGTGYMAAWLTCRLGAENVVSSEIDPLVMQTARAALRRSGFLPRRVLGDALDGLSCGDTPHERIVGTCTIRRITAPALCRTLIRSWRPPRRREASRRRTGCCPTTGSPGRPWSTGQVWSGARSSSSADGACGTRSRVPSCAGNTSADRAANASG